MPLLPGADAFGLISDRLDQHIAYTSGKIAHRLIQRDNVETAVKQAIICQYVQLVQVIKQTENTQAYNDVLSSMAFHYSAAAAASTSDSYAELFSAGVGASMEIKKLTDKYLPTKTVIDSINEVEVFKNLTLQLFKKDQNKSTIAAFCMPIVNNLGSYVDK